MRLTSANRPNRGARKSGSASSSECIIITYGLLCVKDVVKCCAAWSEATLAFLLIRLYQDPRRSSANDSDRGCCEALDLCVGNAHTSLPPDPHKRRSMEDRSTEHACPTFAVFKFGSGSLAKLAKIFSLELICGRLAASDSLLLPLANEGGLPVVLKLCIRGTRSNVRFPKCCDRGFSTSCNV